MDSIIEERKKRWREFYDMKRPAVVLIGISDGNRPFPRNDNIPERIDFAVRSYEAQAERLSWLDDDRIPYLNPYTGTEIFAEAFGCKVVYPDNDMPITLPMLKSITEIARLKRPKLEDSTLMILFDIAKKMRDKHPGGLLALPDIQSPFDVAALILEKTEFFACLIEEPAAIHELVGMTNELLISFLDLWFKTFGKDFIAHYPDYYMPCGITLSEDETGCISREIFAEFSLPHINALSERYGGLGMHCCADAVHQWELFKNLKGLRLLNLGQPADIIIKALDYFDNVCHMHGIDSAASVRSGRCSVLTGWAGNDDALVRLAELRELSGT